MFSALLEGKSPHQTEPSQHLSKNSLPWGYRSKIYFTSLLLQLSSFILPFFPFLLFYQLSLLLTDVTAFPLYFISSSPLWLCKPSCYWCFPESASPAERHEMEQMFLYYICPSLLHHFIHYLTSTWVKWSISTCWIQQPSQEWLKSLSEENTHATIYFSKVYLGRKRKCPSFLGNE